LFHSLEFYVIVALFLDIQVDTFFAVGSPLGVFLSLRNVRIGIGMEPLTFIQRRKYLLILESKYGTFD